MQKHIVLTLTGRDRIGIVDHVTEIILEYNGNVQASKMAHLGGEFAMLMLVTVAENNLQKLKTGLDALKVEGFQVETRETEPESGEKFSGWLPYELKIHGADHEGIIHHITHYLAQNEMNIESMDTGMIQAPMSGTPLFTMTAVIIAPPTLALHKCKEELDHVCDNVNVNYEISPYTG
jgi:glycine cleavage system transcriptional repressor